MSDVRGKSRAKRMRKAARVLAFGGSYREAAEVGGVSAQTIQRWRKKPEFMTMIDELATAAHAPIRLATPGDVEQLASNWREVASIQLAIAIGPAVRTIREALDGADKSKAQLDSAWKLVERMAITAPQEVEQEELSNASETAMAIAEAVDPRILREALRLAEGGS